MNTIRIVLTVLIGIGSYWLGWTLSDTRIEAQESAVTFLESDCKTGIWTHEQSDWMENKTCEEIESLGGIPTKSYRVANDEIGLISNTGMWLIQDGKIGIVIEGEHILTIYREGIPDCQEVR